VGANGTTAAAPGKVRLIGCASRDRCDYNAQRSLCSSGALAAGSGLVRGAKKGGG